MRILFASYNSISVVICRYGAKLIIDEEMNGGDLLIVSKKKYFDPDQVHVYSYWQGIPDVYIILH